MFFVPTSLCQCCFKSGYIVLDKPETMWEGTLVAHIGCCFENSNLGIVIECRIISGEKKKTLMDLWLWRMFVVCRFWFVQQYFLFCVVYTTVPTSTINGRLLNDQRQKLTSVQCKQLFLELVSTPHVDKFYKLFLGIFRLNGHIDLINKWSFCIKVLEIPLQQFIC